MSDVRRFDLGADRRAQAHEEGQGGEPVEFVRPAEREIARQQPVGRGALVALPQVHQREGEIVEDVAGGDVGVERDRVEQGRLAVDQRDVAQVQVAVAAPHPARSPRAISSGRRRRTRRGSRGRAPRRARGANRSGRAAKAAWFWSR